MKKLSFTVDTDNLKPVMLEIWEKVKKGIQSTPIIVELSRPVKSREQEKMYHAMIGDIAKQVDFDGKKFAVDVWKTLLVDQFEEELRQMGTDLSKPGKCVISLDGRRVVQVRPSTTGFLVKEASDLIEYLFSFGAENQISWSDPETQSLYKEYWQKTYEINPDN